MRNEGRPKRQGATKSGPQPGSFPLGSEKSRAAARAVLEAREAVLDEQPLTLVVSRIGHEVALDEETCGQILRESGFLKGPGLRLIDLGKIPAGLSAAETQSFLREHAAEICGPKE